MKTNSLGKLGEVFSVSWLMSEGFIILIRNYLCRYGEIDVVCYKAGELHFTEVKTRCNTSFGRPADAVTALKRQRIIRSAQLYIEERCPKYESIHFDVIEVNFNFIADAFYP